MEMSPWFILLFVLASIGGTALMVVALRAGAKRRERFAAYASENGWRYAFIAPAGSGVTEHEFTDPDAGWTLTIHSYSSGTANNTTSTRAWTEFRMPLLDIPEGMAVLGPDIPRKTQQMANKMMGLMGGDLGQFLLDKMTGGLGAEMQGLRSIESAGPGTLFASPGAETALDDLRFAPELANARVGKNEAQQPIVLRGPFGLRLRVATRLRSVAQIEEFIRLGRALADNLRTG